MSFEDFMDQFKKRHQKEYGLDSRSYAQAKHTMANVGVKVPEIKPLVAKDVVMDRMSQSAGDDWDGVDEYGDFTEVVE